MDIQIQNEYWQIFYNRNLTYYIFGAYLDSRPLVSENKTVIRLLVMVDLISTNDNDYPPAYCQLWFRNKFPPVVVPVETIQSIWLYAWGHDPQYSFPHILTCVVPKTFEKWQPKSVSLVATPCDKATNLLRVVYKPLKPLEKKKEFAVCIKGLDFLYTDLSYRLVEYFESLRILGAQKIMIYYLQTHENITKVLNYYKSTGFLEYRPFTFSLKYSNLPEYRHLQIKTRNDAFILHETMAYNDCFYRNMYKYKYIGVWDIDELPLPLKNNTNWHDLIEITQNYKNPKCKSYASLCFYCAYFPSFSGNFTFNNQFPYFFYMLQHVKRVEEYAAYGSATKCFHNTDLLIATHNHFPIHHAAECRDYTFNTTDAQMNHYREPPFTDHLLNTVVDKRLWNYGSEIVENSLKIYKELDFLKDLKFV